jgi:hypothetical protein
MTPSAEHVARSHLSSRGSLHNEGIRAQPSVPETVSKRGSVDARPMRTSCVWPGNCITIASARHTDDLDRATGRRAPFRQPGSQPVSGVPSLPEGIGVPVKDGDVLRRVGSVSWLKRHTRGLWVAGSEVVLTDGVHDVADSPLRKLYGPEGSANNGSATSGQYHLRQTHSFNRLTSVTMSVHHSSRRYPCALPSSLHRQSVEPWSERFYEPLSGQITVRTSGMPPSAH